ncbi:unnamed protein product [Pieris macdunnoughi]|uniref:Uncharacterized protein n=1 Tax=Pieris macdunnoughi TaxID=345717 RepID=A0A821U6Z3_9NEOP|nr:unnamed protein product [Pieris macdunnoughi]
MDRQTFGVFFAITLLAHGFCLPSHIRMRRQESTSTDTTDLPLTVNNEDTEDKDAIITVKESYPVSVPIDPSDDDIDDLTPAPASSGGGSSIFSIFHLLGAVLPSSILASTLLQNILRLTVDRLTPHIIVRRQINDIDYVNNLKPTFQRQENESDSGDSMDSEETDDDRNSNQELDSEMDSVEDEYDEPEGDGQGGGILGLLAGLSGGEDGQSDLGSLLATVSGIIANLSGDGIDLNALIASGIGLFVGLLSEGNENPGSVIASYFLTSLDTITGGGSTNNGAFFGNLLSKLIQGTSAALDPDASSEENEGPQMKDSAGFFSSLLMALLGNMSKGSSGGSHPWRRYLEIHES